MRCAVLGDPIAHSLSPVLHRAGYAAAGLTDVSYDSVQVGEAALAAYVDGLGAQWRGLSLTMPLKRLALDLAPRVADRARLAGGANTLLLEQGRPVLADNTDLPGAAAAVRERYDGPVSAVTVLGGGATAASTGLAMCDLGARRVRLLARSADRAAATAAAVAAHPAAPTVEVGALADGVVDGEVVVSTIPSEAQSADLVARVAEAPVVFEALYDPWPTPLAASADGRVLVSGLDLLVHQAVLQFEMFTGVPAPLEEMRTAGETELRARHHP
ncbi:shikimate dehydrogenase [Nocardioides sp. YIM 152315]|uniref:shikimate dehydrogenase n=1 Tax=Nocardioides sp. YIM 152315 TaxID=3031760 RepID=UPI0023DCCDE1|nr:shikimate dehydrogenase [Nocardioides sp. YIM 152315]MDF1605605.1 shikimate dehydrogenase [Nocardioides sp. YIM 152315]